MLAIVADDLTGALDTGAPFARCGLHTEVALNTSAIAGALAQRPDVLSINLGSRELDEAQARSVAREAYAALPVGTRLFKKVDSRLKGHIAAELDCLPFSRALVAPAIPAFGRFVRGGYVEGFGVDQPIHVAAKLGDHSARCWIADTVSQQDMERAIDRAETDGVDLLIGARGLAEALAIRMSGRALGGLESLPAGAGLFVIGSHDPITLKQVETLRAACDISYRAAPNGVVTSSAPAVRSVVLVQAVPGDVILSAQEVSRNLASSVHPVLTSGARTLLLCGGATAEAVLAQMGIDRFRLSGECLPGLGLAYAGDQCIIAKSGGFGAPDALAVLAERLLQDMG